MSIVEIQEKGILEEEMVSVKVLRQEQECYCS